MKNFHFTGYCINRFCIVTWYAVVQTTVSFHAVVQTTVSFQEFLFKFICIKYLHLPLSL